MFILKPKKIVYILIVCAGHLPSGYVIKLSTMNIAVVTTQNYFNGFIIFTDIIVIYMT